MRGRCVLSHFSRPDEQRQTIVMIGCGGIERPEKHHVGIEHAADSLRDAAGHRDLCKLLDVPAAHRLGSHRPPISPPFAQNESRQRPEPGRQHLRERHHEPPSAIEFGEHLQFLIGNDEIVVRKRRDVAIHAFTQQRASLQIERIGWRYEADRGHVMWPPGALPRAIRRACEIVTGCKPACWALRNANSSRSGRMPKRLGSSQTSWLKKISQPLIRTVSAISLEISARSIDRLSKVHDLSKPRSATPALIPGSMDRQELNRVSR